MGVWDWSLHKNTLIWNENSAKIFDYHHSNLEREFSDFESRVHLEDKKMVTESLALAIEQGRKFKEEFRIVLPSGEIKSVLSIATRYTTIIKSHVAWWASYRILPPGKKLRMNYSKASRDYNQSSTTLLVVFI